MPPSFGLSHLRTKTQPKNTYEERLRALTIVDEEDRTALAAQWRNTHRPITRGNGDSPRDHHHSGMNSSRQMHGGGGASSTTGVDLTLRSTTASLRREARGAPLGQQATAAASVGLPTPPRASTHHNGGGETFLSPPTTAVRGPMSYLEDPRTARLDRNEYVVYFRSTVHDVDVARALVASAPSSKKKPRRSGSGHPQEVLLPHNDGPSTGGGDDPHDRSIANSTTTRAPQQSSSHQTAATSGGGAMLHFGNNQPAAVGHPPLVYQQYEFDELKSTSTLQHHSNNKNASPTKMMMMMMKQGSGPTMTMGGGGITAASTSPSVSDAWAASLQETSMMSIPTILLNQQQRQEMGVLGIGHASPLWDDDADADDLDGDLDDDLGFSPSSSKRASAAKKQQRAATKKRSGNMNNSAKLASTGSLVSSSNQAASLSLTANSIPGFPKTISGPPNTFQGHLPKFADNAGGNTSQLPSSSSAHNHHRSSGVETLPDHAVDRARMRHHKPKYAAPVIDVTTLKPKCAALHVKLEKISQRMKSEDDEFNAFLNGYLSKLRPY